MARRVLEQHPSLTTQLQRDRARLSRLLLAAVPGLDEGARGAAWLRRVEIKASAAPVEEGLDALPVTAELRSTTPDGRRAASVVGATVGPMKVRCEWVHRRPGAAGARHELAELVAAMDDGPYGLALHDQRQAIEQVDVAVAQSRARALVSVLPLDDHSPAPVVSMVDAFVVSLQLGQVLLYELDGVERARSNTLWMRSTTLTCDGPHRATDAPFQATASLADPRLLTARGGTWRAASITGESLGMRTHCAVAHQLPDTHRVPPALVA